MSGYGLLHYPGDLTRWDGARPGRLLGHDEFGRPYAVIDAEVEMCPGLRAEPKDPESCAPCALCRGTALRTVVHLEYATPDQIRAAVTR